MGQGFKDYLGAATGIGPKIAMMEESRLKQMQMLGDLYQNPETRSLLFTNPWANRMLEKYGTGGAQPVDRGSLTPENYRQRFPQLSPGDEGILPYITRIPGNLPPEVMTKDRAGMLKTLAETNLLQGGFGGDPMRGTPGWGMTGWSPKTGPKYGWLPAVPEGTQIPGAGNVGGGDLLNDQYGPQGGGGVPRRLGGGTGGTRANRNNNPGNIKASKFTQSLPGVIGIDPTPAADGGHFLIFDSPENGFGGMHTLLRHGYSNLPSDAALRRWSGGGYGAGDMGVDPTRPIASYTDAELHELTQRMAKREGYRGGPVLASVGQQRLGPGGQGVGTTPPLGGAQIASNAQPGASPVGAPPRRVAAQPKTAPRKVGTQPAAPAVPPGQEPLNLGETPVPPGEQTAVGAPPAPGAAPQQAAPDVAAAEQRLFGTTLDNHQATPGEPGYPSLAPGGMGPSGAGQPPSAPSPAPGVTAPAAPGGAGVGGGPAPTPPAAPAPVQPAPQGAPGGGVDTGGRPVAPEKYPTELRTAMRGAIERSATTKGGLRDYLASRGYTSLEQALSDNTAIAMLQNDLIAQGMKPDIAKAFVTAGAKEFAAKGAQVSNARTAREVLRMYRQPLGDPENPNDPWNRHTALDASTESPRWSQFTQAVGKVPIFGPPIEGVIGPGGTGTGLEPPEWMPSRERANVLGDRAAAKMEQLQGAAPLFQRALGDVGNLNQQEQEAVRQYFLPNPKYSRDHNEQILRNSEQLLNQILSASQKGPQEAATMVQNALRAAGIDVAPRAYDPARYQNGIGLIGE